MASPYNASLTAPGWGTVDFWVTELHYGSKVIAEESQTAWKKVFYPKIRTSGGWGVTVTSPSKNWYMAFQTWMKNYIYAITDPDVNTPQPMVLTVPSRGFTKKGYPESSVVFMNRKEVVVWEVQLEFSSASDLADPVTQSSRYVAGGGNSDLFYPGGNQDASEIDPIVDPWSISGNWMTSRR